MNLILHYFDYLSLIVFIVALIFGNDIAVGIEA